LSRPWPSPCQISPPFVLDMASPSQIWFLSKLAIPYDCIFHDSRTPLTRVCFLLESYVGTRVWSQHFLWCFSSTGGKKVLSSFGKDLTYMVD
jgi:hypothetical protein